MEETELMLPTQVKEAFAKVLQGYGMCGTSTGREYYRCELARVAQAAKRVDPEFYADLVELGYVVDPGLERDLIAPVPRDISERFLTACNAGDRAQLLELQSQEPDLYKQELEGLMRQVQARINQLRVEGGSVRDELVLRGNLKRLVRQIPGVELGGPALGRPDIEAERAELSKQLQLQRSLSVSLKEYRRIALRELTQEVVDLLSPRELQAYMQEIFDRGGFIPGELGRAFNSGVSMREM
ncbi:MAG: hypothetical protein ABIE03_06155 [Patescibacteria group bacterium]|nr:hypothetical protein [Patescibacteria group bacterium]